MKGLAIIKKDLALPAVPGLPSVGKVNTTFVTDAGCFVGHLSNKQAGSIFLTGVILQTQTGYRLTLAINMHLILAV